MRARIPIHAFAIVSFSSICAADAVLYAVHAPPPAVGPSLDSLSSDGTAAAGSATLAGLRPMRWTIDGGSIALTGPDSGLGEGLGCSGAGQVVTGFAGLYAGLTGYRWNETDGWVVMPLPPDTWYTVPRAISEDGLAIATWIIGTGGYLRPARWTESLGYEILHNVPTDNAMPIAMSGDGSDQRIYLDSRRNIVRPAIRRFV